MFVLKRSGERQPVMFDKITTRVTTLCTQLEGKYPLENVDPALVTQAVARGVHSGIRTSELDQLAAEEAIYMSTTHPDYGELAARLVISNLQKQTSSSFVEVVQRLHAYINPKTQKHSPLVSNELLKLVEENSKMIEDIIDYSRDFNYDYFGFKTLERSYLIKEGTHIVERPQHMLMRVSLGVWGSDLVQAFKTYELMSTLMMTHATPTLFNAGTPRPQCSSCFLLSVSEDSIEGIYDTLTRCAKISKSAGGIGVNLSNVRAKNSHIAGTNGKSNGLVPMLKVFNETARYVDQGGGKRKGAFAVYLEPWHADVMEFLEMKKNTGAEEVRARDLFYALWVPDLFMQRVEEGKKWSLFCPNECPGLQDAVGDEFDKLYTRYEIEGKARKTLDAREVWFAILESQMETGTPYILYKDACNLKSNQSNLGTIKGSNLCSEIIEYTSEDEVAVCNLASIALPKFVENGKFNFEALYATVVQITCNLNRIIDINYYPVQEARNSNLTHRPVGIGVQGLADTFLLLKMAFDSEEARTLNKHIFETIYYAALSASCTLAQNDGPYSSYEGSPASKGLLQHDLWGVDPECELWDWNELKERVLQYGLRNSLLVACMPTASTSQILGNAESFEPYTSNIFSRRVLAGDFPVINKHLVRELCSLGMWNDNIKSQLIKANGSIQNIAELSDEIKLLYRTIWEIPQRSLIDMAADRGAFIDQSQSFSVYIAQPTFEKMSSMHFYGWKRGLKTGMYYLRSRPAVDPIKFTLRKKDVLTNGEKEIKTPTTTTKPQVIKIQEEEEDDAFPMCLACGS